MILLTLTLGQIFQRTPYALIVWLTETTLVNVTHLGEKPVYKGSATSPTQGGKAHSQHFPDPLRMQILFDLERPNSARLLNWGKCKFSGGPCPFNQRRCGRRGWGNLSFVKARSHHLMQSRQIWLHSRSWEEVIQRTSWTNHATSLDRECVFN